MDGVNNRFSGGSADSPLESSADSARASSSSDTLLSLPDAAQDAAVTLSAVAKAIIPVENGPKETEVLLERLPVEKPEPMPPLLEPLAAIPGVEPIAGVRQRSDSNVSVFTDDVIASSNEHNYERHISENKAIVSETISSLEKKIAVEEQKIKHFEELFKKYEAGKNEVFLMAVYNELAKKNESKKSLEVALDILHQCKETEEAKGNFKPTREQLEKLAKADSLDYIGVVCDIYKLTDRPPNESEINVARDAVKNFQQPRYPGFTFGSD